ncbi:MAG: hypothetical protein Q8937_10355 [Bacteroidota bacterium]|nr:hypothetical protein [Bacteroidota bacterium]
MSNLQKSAENQLIKIWAWGFWPELLSRVDKVRARGYKEYISLAANNDYDKLETYLANIYLFNNGSLHKTPGAGHL